MTRLRAPTLLWLGLLFVVLPCLALVLVSYYQAARIAPGLEQGRAQVAHTFDVLRAAQALDGAMQDAERGQRGFLVTSDEAYLEPYQRGIESAPRLFTEIQRLTEDNPEQQRKLPVLKNLIDTKLAELARTIEARKRIGFDAARQMVMTNVGADAMRAIITIIDAFVATEDGLLNERLARVAEIEAQNRAAAVISGVLALISMALGIGTVLMAFRDVQTSQERWRTAEEHLGQFVSGVTEYAIYTTKEVGKGTGLGLSQVYGFIKQSGGHIKLYSELGQGTTVKLYLPRLYGSDAALEISSVVSEVPASENARAAILLVEDDEQVRNLTAEMLAALGYRVMLASNGPEALRALTQHEHIDLLFTDVGLPDGMNGRQLAEEARRIRPALKVLFTTGYARNAIVHHGRLDPGVELILKPFTAVDVAQKIRKILENSPAVPASMPSPRLAGDDD